MVCSSSTLRRLACAFLCLGSSLAWSQSQPVFPVLHYDPYAVASPLAMTDGDVNGDGIIDTLYAAASGSTGSSTLTSAPRDASGATPAGATFTSASIGDIDGDGHPDLILQHMTDMAGFTLAYGDGAGDFTVDPNTYTTGSKIPVSGALVRLNNQATSPYQPSGLSRRIRRRCHLCPQPEEPFARPSFAGAHADHAHV